MVLGVAVSLVLLAVVLVAAVAKFRRAPESLVAVLAAAVVLMTGLVSAPAAVDELSSLAPVLVFLVAVLTLGACCAAEGVFTAVGGWLARSARSSGRLLAWVFAVAAVTCVLGLDATVVLLTPVVLAAATRVDLPRTPYVYATGHVANAGSLLLPTGNLTNLLALSAAGLTVVHFTALMALPWLLVLGVEYVVLRRYFRRDLQVERPRVGQSEVATPWFAMVVLAMTLVGFVVTSLLDIAPFWPAVLGAVVLAVHAVRTGLVRASAVVSAVDLPFVLFVAGLAVVVRAAVDNGLGDAVEWLLPTSASFGGLLATAVLAALLANVVNNLPAVLILLPVAAPVGALAVLAVLIGVNVGPNLTYPGSLATLLWRRVLSDHGMTPSLRRFTIVGLLTVPACLVAGVSGLWVAGQL